MIDTEDAKVQEVIQGIHEALLRKVRRESYLMEKIVTENQIFSIICGNFDLGSTGVASLMSDRYNSDMTTEEVIRIFCYRKMADSCVRKEIVQWADRVTSLFPEVIQGNRDAFDAFEKARREPVLKNGIRFYFLERLLLLMIYEKYPEIDAFGDTDNLFQLSDALARHFLFEICNVICEVYGFPQYRDKKQRQSKRPEKKLSHDQALRRVEHLENTLERMNVMLQELQDEFEEQLEADKAKELADFFGKLNSERYGCILDELLVIRKGVDDLRKRHYELPIELNGLLIMVKKLIQFVRDSHIEPVMRIGDIREVMAADVEFCNYEGTPFATPEEKKKVKVVSPGWVYKDKELQISRPRVKEEA